MKAEQFIKDYTNHCSNEMVFEDGSGSHLYEPWITPEQALRAVEIAREEMIEKACGWLKSHYRDYMYNPTGERLEAFFGGDMCNDFENYMMEK